MERYKNDDGIQWINFQEDRIVRRNAIIVYGMEGKELIIIVKILRKQKLVSQCPRYVVRYLIYRVKEIPLLWGISFVAALN
jgi:hypothetical protein